MLNNNMNDYASKSLGSENSYAIYSDKFDPSLLNPMPRSAARKDWDITGEEFKGFDIWHCYESTFLLNNGSPVAGTLKICIPSNSEFMVESKSFKLYLNSFDMCKMGDTYAEAILNYETQVKKDISDCVKSNSVSVKFFESARHKEHDPLKKYVDIMSLININNIEITDYYSKESFTITQPAISQSNKDKNTVYWIYSNVLRSRCRHTKQKDTGTAAFRIEVKKGSSLNFNELFKLIVSLREVNEFHEFCAEKLFVEIMKDQNIAHCEVMLLYSRRGSLDINPIRSTKKVMNPSLVNVCYYTKKTQGQ